MGGDAPAVPPPHRGVLLGGRYRLGDLLGTGGMADVYEAVDERLGRVVAVKVLRPEMATRADVRLRFESEARSAASLTHPNVVAVFDSGEDEGVPYLVMEKLPGETLADRMAAGPVDTAWLLRVAGDVVSALGAAHAAGIVHRDVKPGNVLMTTDGCAKVADFGIAKSLEVAAAADLTGTNQLVGTPAYVAPERILGQPATPQADLYGVGVLLYEALAGRKPFAGNTPVATAYAIQHETPPPLSELRPDLPAHVVAAVERAMAREPGARFATAGDLARALRVGPDSTDATVVASDDATAVLPAGATATGASAASATVVGAVSPVAAKLLDRRHRPLVIGGAVVALLLLLLAFAVADGGEEPEDASRRALAAELREEADGLDATDGEASDDAAAALAGVASAVEAGGGGPEATALLGRLAGWRDAGALRPEAVERVAALLRRVPGADPAALTPPTTSPPPTTPPPPREERREAEEDRDDGKDDEGEDKGEKGRGKKGD